MGQQDKVILLNHHLCPKRGNTVPQWAFKLNSGLATAENWDLKGQTLKVKMLHSLLNKYTYKI
jgi:hypothetical protein